MLNLRHLQYLNAVYQYKNFTQAGDSLFVSQPTISAAINTLESDLGVKLIERSSKRVIFTYEGAKNPSRLASLDAPLKAAYGAADKHGLLDKVYFGILGHGIGTDLHIAPTIGDLAVADGGKVEREVNTLQPGLVIALEPGIYLDGIGGGCCENMTLITENGPEVLTKTRFDERLLLR